MPYQKGTGTSESTVKPVTLGKLQKRFYEPLVLLLALTEACIISLLCPTRVLLGWIGLRKAVLAPCSREGQPSPSSSFTFADPSVARPRSELHTAFELIRAACRGSLPADLPCLEWHVLSISPAEFADVCERLEREGLFTNFEKLRYDYS